MTANHRAPVIFLAFANEQQDRTRYLRALPEETRSLRSALAAAQQLCHLEVRTNVTLNEIRDVFRQYDNRIALFHFGGHADSYQLLLEADGNRTAAIDATAFAEFLAQQAGLQLVFLNACSTAEQVAALQAAGIPLVIATTDDILDTVATDFASQFYTSLATGTNSVARAFAEADALTRAGHGGNLRHLRPAEHDQPAAQSSPWRLYTAPSGEENSTWTLQQAANDPLFGLPPLPRRDLPATPYRHLAWFRREDAEIFFGRGWEIADLYQRVTTPDSAPIILFYGQSGVGKSSVLAAGLLPRLEQKHRVAYQRRTEAGLTGALFTALSASAAADPLFAWQVAEQQAERPLTVILDQVEEVFTRPDPANPNELADFLDTLTTLFTNPDQRPHGRLILSFRKEWLAEIEQRLVERQLPHANVFLERLDQTNVMEAVAGPGRTARLRTHYNLGVADDLPSLIADDLLADPNSPVAPMLQILLQGLWTAAKARNHDRPVFDRSLYADLRAAGLGLDDFLARQLTALRVQQAAAVESGLVLDLLAYHTTALGTAEQRPTAAVEQLYQHQATLLPALLQECRTLYLLVDPVANQPSQPAANRLTHDTLAPHVRRRFDESDAPGQRARRTLENRAVDWAHARIGAPLDEQDLTLVEQGAAGMRGWTPAEQTLVAASQRARMTRVQERQRADRIRWVLRRVILAVTVAIVLLSTLFWLREQHLWQEQAQREAQRLAEKATQSLPVDPVVSLHLSLRALPAPALPQPYLPQAEFALTQALHTSLERSYLKVSTTPLTRPEQVALTRDWIAVGGDALRLVPYSLDPTQVHTLTQATATIQAVEWYTDGETLLSREAYTLSIWHNQTLLAQHLFPAGIACTAWRPGHEQIAVCAGEELYLWSYREKTLKPIYAFPNTVNDAHWSPDGRWLAGWDSSTLSTTQTLLTWDSLAAQTAFTQAVAHADRINDLAWSPDGQYWVAARSGGSIYIQPVTQPQGGFPKTVDEEQAGIEVDRIAFVDSLGKPARFVTWGLSDIGRLWSLDGKLLQSFGASQTDAQEVHLLPGTEQLLTFANKGGMQLWDLNIRTPLAEFLGQDQRVWAAVAQQGYLATSSVDGTARLWSITECRGTCDPLITLNGHQPGGELQRKDVLGVAWQGQQLLTWGKDGTLRRWQVLDEQGRPLCNGTVLENYPNCYGFSRAFTATADVGTRIISATWLDNATILAVNNENSAWRFGLTTGQTTQWQDPTQYSDEDIPIVLWSPDGQRLFTYVDGSDQVQEGRVWDRTSQTPSATISGVIHSVFWLQAGLLISLADSPARLISPDNGQTLLEFEGQFARITAAALAADGRLATADENGTICIWDRQSGQPCRAFQLDPPLPLQAMVHELHWNPAGTHLLVASRNLVSLWNTATLTRTWQQPTAAAQSHVAFSPQADFVAITNDTNDKGFVVLHAADGAILWRNDAAHAQRLVGIAWVKGTRWAHQDRYNFLLNNLIRWSQGGAWRQDDNRLLLLTWGGDGTARLWDWEQKTEIMRLTDSAPLEFAAVSEDGRHLFTAGDSGVVRVWQVWLQQPEEMVAQAQTLRHRLLTAGQLESFGLAD